MAVGALNARAHEAGIVVVDCRFTLKDPAAGRAAYAAAHIPGALYLDLDQDLAAVRTATSGRHPLPAVSTFVATLGRCGVTRTSQVVAYDDAGGVYASRLWWLLRWLGHDAVAVLDGGLQAWQAAGLPLTADVRPAMMCAYGSPLTNDRLWHDTPSVVAMVADESAVLIDARGPTRYRGETEPFDPVAGHIPGALNHPYDNNLTADKTFRPAAELRARFRTLLGDTDPADVVHYCGSGVSACANVLAMEIAGLGMTRLYPGSWSAWVSDPTRPVACGPPTQKGGGRG